MVILGEIFPNFTALTTEGPIDFHEWLGFSWAILFSHPYDFTPICTTELARVVTLMPEFTRLGVKVIGLSCDPVDSHRDWIKDIKCYANMSEEGFPYPIIADENRVLAKSLDMLHPDNRDDHDLPLPVRAVFIIDPDMKMRLTISYPVTVGRNFDEIIRVIEALQISHKHSCGTPVDWKKGEDVIVNPFIPIEQAQKKYGDSMKIVDLPSGKPYLRLIPQPKD